MQTSETYKRSYRPLLIVLFHLKLLDAELLRQIPYSTKKHWNDIEQENQFGYEVVHDYLEAQLNIVSVYKSKQLYRFIRFVCRINDGYMNPGKYSLVTLFIFHKMFVFHLPRA